MQYHRRVHELAQRVRRYIRDLELLHPGDRVGVAVSGGADSVALLRLLLELREELGVVLSLVHVNHQIRGADADADQQFVTDLARLHALPLHASAADTPAEAATRRLSLEAAAREIRYRYFEGLLTEGLLDKIATAHTLDDQAETVLLRLARGSGIKGLAGIYPEWLIRARVGTGLRQACPEQLKRSEAVERVQGERSSPPSASDQSAVDRRPRLSCAAVVRPLLQVRRSDLQAYLRDFGQPWREDATNLDLRFTRNRVRHKILPQLENELNPRIRDLLAETAEIARAEESYWAGEVSRALTQAWSAPDGSTPGLLRIAALLRHPLALQRRILRAATESLGVCLEFQHVDELLGLVQAPPMGEKQVVLPGGWRALRLHDQLRFEPPQPGQAIDAPDFAYSLHLPGEVAVPETGTIFRVTVVPVSQELAGEAYDPTRLPHLLQVRNWRPGDRFWPAHTKAPRKIKELLQDRKVPPTQRHMWPVITSAASGHEEVIWMRGFPPPQQLLAPCGGKLGLIIQEYALQQPVPGAE